MREKPRNPKENIFNKELFGELLISGLSIGIIIFIVWVYLLNKGVSVTTARGYILMLMVFMQNMHVLNCRSEKKSAFTISLKTNPFVAFSIFSAIMLQIIVSEIPALSTLLQTTSIPITNMLILFVISTIIILIMEIYKYIIKKSKKEQ